MRICPACGSEMKYHCDLTKLGMAINKSFKCVNCGLTKAVGRIAVGIFNV